MEKDKAERLAAALRENLRKRKAQGGDLNGTGERENNGARIRSGRPSPFSTPRVKSLRRAQGEGARIPVFKHFSGGK